jgi:hypothetical protein
MDLMNKAPALALSLMAACAVSACSETAVQDMLGSGKASVPDSSQVTVGQSLSMPPDLQLRAPSEAPVENTQVAAAQPVGTVQPVQPVSSSPPDPQALAGTQTASTEPPKQDVYVRYGISKTYPDGKPKPDRILIKELHDAQLAEKRRANPNYGTVWNMGELFKDW